MFLPVLFSWAALCAAQDLDSTARELSRKIAPGRQEVASLVVRNASSLSTAEAGEITGILETELRVRPVRAKVLISTRFNTREQVFLDFVLSLLR